MGASVRPQKTIVQKMRENLEYMRARPDEFTREDQEQEIQIWKAKLDEESANERKLSGAEKVAAFGSKLASGATFGGFDELAEVLPFGDTDTQRYLQDQYGKENPALAAGAEVAGAYASPGSFLKIARNMSRAQKATRVVGEGLIQGALSGAGNANGTLEDRLRGAAYGGGAGSVVAGVIGGTARGVGAVRRAGAMRRGVHTPPLEDLVNTIPESHVDRARQRFAELEGRGLGDEARLADVLPDGEGLLRAQRTANKDVAKHIDTELRGRSNRLANIADDRLSQHTGTQKQSAVKSVKGIVDEARAKAKPLYDAAEQEAGAFDPVTAGPEFKLPEILQRPYVKRMVQRVIADDPKTYGGNVFEDAALSHRLLDQVYKEIGEDIRYLNSKVKARTASASERRRIRPLMRQRDELLDAMKVRAPGYPKALDAYAGEMQLKNAYEAGAKDTPADMIPDEMSGMSASEQRMFREAKAQKGRANVPNPELGEFARFSDVLAPVGSKEKADVFKATFGEDAYREYMADLLEMAKMQRMKAGAGQSETVDKLIEQIQLGGNNDLMPLVMQLATGTVGPRQGLSRALNAVGVDRLLASKGNAKRNADWLLRGGKDTPMLLDEILREHRLANTPSFPALERGRRGLIPTSDLTKNAAAREAGAFVGRRSKEPR